MIKEKHCASQQQKYVFQAKTHVVKGFFKHKPKTFKKNGKKKINNSNNNNNNFNRLKSNNTSKKKSAILGLWKIQSCC